MNHTHNTRLKTHPKNKFVQSFQKKKKKRKKKATMKKQTYTHTDKYFLLKHETVILPKNYN